MAHLSRDELVEVAEGLEADPSGHLQICRECRRKVADLQAILSAAEGVPLPEPSPLFWDHLSARVREAIQADTAGQHRRQAWMFPWQGWRVPVGLSAVAVLLVAVVFGARLRVPLREPAVVPATSGSTEAVATAAPDPSGGLDDPWIDVVGGLTDDLDWDAISSAGLTARAGDADVALTQLTDEERQELERVLKESLNGLPQPRSGS